VVAYTAGGVLLGSGVLAALYYWDRKGGDLKGKVRLSKPPTANCPRAQRCQTG
jgi:hypothetical protein